MWWQHRVLCHAPSLYKAVRLHTKGKDSFRKSWGKEKNENEFKNTWKLTGKCKKQLERKFNEFQWNSWRKNNCTFRLLLGNVCAQEVIEPLKPPALAGHLDIFPRPVEDRTGNNIELICEGDFLWWFTPKLVITFFNNVHAVTLQEVNHLDKNTLSRASIEKLDLQASQFLSHWWY